MLLHRLGERTEDHAHFRQLVLEGGGDRDAVEHRVHRDAGQHLLLGQRNAQLLVGAQNLRIELVQALQLRLLLGRRVVGDVLIVDRRIVDVRPLRLAFLLLKRRPVAKGLQPPLQHELGLVLLGRDQANDVFVQTLGDALFFNVGDEAPLVFALRQIIELY